VFTYAPWAFRLGALALDLEAHVPLSRVVGVATWLIVDPKLPWLTRVLRHVLPYQTNGTSYSRDPAALAVRAAYDRTAARSGEQILRLLPHLHDDLPVVYTPALPIHSLHDWTVDPATMPQVYERLGVRENHTTWLGASTHIGTEDSEREPAHATIRDFIEERIVSCDGRPAPNVS
jgi:esterase/lipase